ncbi:hypothetical protein [Polaromonas naphthalenivorans]|nr:hypothetical protein [Polaromonas naphthalenivorans]
MTHIKEIVSSNEKKKELSSEEFNGLVGLIKSMVDAKKEYAIVKEQEATKRYAINSDLNKYLAKVNIQKEILETHLANEFKIRKEAISEIFSRLDVAIDSGNDAIAVAALTAIHGIVIANPLAGIGEMKKVFENTDGILEL